MTYNTYGPQFGAVPAARTRALSLPEKVMGLTTMLIAAAVGGVALGASGLNTVFSSHTFIWFIVEIGLLLAAQALADRPGIGMAVFLAFGASTGILIAPLIQFLTLSGQSGTVYQALGATAAATFGITLYARTTTRDFSNIGGYLLAGLIGLIVASVIGIFIHSTGFSILISGIACVLFSLFLVYDVQRITQSDNTRGNALRLALGIYLDIFNLFINLLSILELTSNNRN